jgi:hypothetical protein
MGKSVTSVARQALEGLGSVAGLRFGTEEPPYSHTRLAHGVEIRHYDCRIAAQTTVFSGDDAAALSAGFRRLAGYIFGGNHRRTKIAMTAPVSQHAGEAEGSVIRFYLPAEFTMAQLPTPTDDSVVLVQLPMETVAALRFSGDRRPSAVATRTAKLLDVLQDNNFKPNGPPTAWFYDPPWTLPFRRRNEVAVAITPL